MQVRHLLVPGYACGSSGEDSQAWEGMDTCEVCTYVSMWRGVHACGCVSTCVRAQEGVCVHCTLSPYCLVMPPLSEHAAGIPLSAMPAPSGSEVWASCSQNQSQGLMEGSVLGLVLRGPPFCSLSSSPGLCSSFRVREPRSWVEIPLRSLAPRPHGITMSKSLLLESVAGQMLSQWRGGGSTVSPLPSSEE